jgi:hypothetical protein
LQSASQNREESADSLPYPHTTYSSHWSKADTKIKKLMSAKEYFAYLDTIRMDTSVLEFPVISDQKPPEKE